MTVRGKGNVDSIGCTTSAARVVRTIPESSRLTQQIALPQARGREGEFDRISICSLFSFVNMV